MGRTSSNFSLDVSLSMCLFNCKSPSCIVKHHATLHKQISTQKSRNVCGSVQVASILPCKHCLHLHIYASVSHFVDKTPSNPNGNHHFTHQLTPYKPDFTSLKSYYIITQLRSGPAVIQRKKKYFNLTSTCLNGCPAFVSWSNMPNVTCFGQWALFVNGTMIKAIW